MVNIRKLKEDEVEKWLVHCTYVFTKGAMTREKYEYFSTHYYNEPYQNKTKILVMVENDEILSTVKIIDRQIHVNGNILKMGGIAEVSTKPEHGGKGYSSMLIRHAIHIMEDEGYHLTVLSAGIPDFYKKFGWEKITINENIIGTSIQDIRQRLEDKLPQIPQNELWGYLPDKWVIRDVDYDHDIQDLSDIYSQYSSKFNGSIVRDEIYWDKWIRNEGKSVKVLSDADHHILGYIDIGIWDEEMLTIKDFGCKHENDDISSIIFFELLSRRLEAHFEQCREPYPGQQENIKIVIPAVIDKNAFGLNIIEKFDYTRRMARMITPFKCGEVLINNTNDLIHLLEKRNEDGGAGYFYWSVDKF